MLGFLPRRRARIKGIEAEADALIGELGPVGACAEARRREREASSVLIARDWDRVAMAIAKRAGFAPSLEDLSVGERAGHQPPRHSGASALDRLNHAVSAKPERFRVQCVGAANGHEPSILKEVGIEAADVASAIVAAAALALPPMTKGLRIVDREGRIIFARQKAPARDGANAP
jgi:hypothetical protein